MKRRTMPAQGGDSAFDPASLAELARSEAPELPWLPGVLASCGPGQWDGPAYLRFVPSNNANQPGAAWQFDANLVLEHKVWGTLVLDILKGEQVGGIEFLDRL